ncbi:hypothetical protein GGR56DRAFT_634767 [Xylariaceae sp. FL0804]|nr:hypothetical protein GGR56DRAFT_634767 [Xylariaceae sp. FL0804]
MKMVLQAAARRGDKVPPNEPVCTFMLLRRDLPAFCQVLQEGDRRMAMWSTDIAINLSVGPMPAPKSIWKRPRTLPEVSFDDFYSEATQKSLLASFAEGIKGFKNVLIKGRVAPHIVKTMEGEISQDKWSDPNAILNSVEGRASPDKSMAPSSLPEDVFRSRTVG